jgi:hypothetical protein
MFPLQIEHPLTQQRHFVWFENPVVLRPLKETGLSSADERLFPRDCREGVRMVLGIMSPCRCAKAAQLQFW